MLRRILLFRVQASFAAGEGGGIGDEFSVDESDADAWDRLVLTRLSD